jgi:predicted kinase
MPTLHLTCGLPGAGKTTLARQLERQHGALRLTTDEWLVRLFGADITMAENELFRGRLEGLLLDTAVRALELGVDVVLDFGVWSRSEREEFRARAAAAGARSELHYLDVPLDELLARLAIRNEHEPAGTFRIREHQLRLWATWFEAPSPDELQSREPGRTYG